MSSLLCTYHSCVLGSLKHKTRIIATNALHMMPYADEIIVLSRGRIVEHGTYEELSSSGVHFNASMADGASSSAAAMPDSPPALSRCVILSNLGVAHDCLSALSMLAHNTLPPLSGHKLRQ